MVQANNLSVTFEMEKSDLIHFSNQKKPITTTLFLQNGNLLEPSETVKWLGIWFDRKLTFKCHTDKRIQLAHGALRRVKQLASASKGLHFHQLRQLYITCVTSVMDYGSVLWQGKRGSIGLNNKFQKLQNQAVVYITGAFPKSPIKALEVEAAIMPSKIRHIKHEFNYTMRLLKLQQSHPVQQQLIDPLQDELNASTCPDLGIFNMLDKQQTQLSRLRALLQPFSSLRKLEANNSMWMAPWNIPSISINISTKPKELACIEHQTFIKEIPLDVAIVYTDGSLSKDNISSIGFVIYLPFTREIKCISYNLGKSIGITDAETYCILKAIQYLKKLIPAAPYQIFTDSQASLQRILGKTNHQAHQIRNSAKECSLKIDWCPAHLGIEGNELADSLAKGAAKKKAFKKDMFTSHSFLKQKSKEYIVKEWQKYWETELLREEEGRKCRGLGKYYRIQAQLHTPNITLRPFDFHGHNRLEESGYFQVLTGIGNTRAYLNMIGKVKDHWCNFCHSRKQTTKHLVLHCTKFRRERDIAFAGIEPRILPIILRTKRGREALLKFLKTSQCISKYKGDI